MKEENQNIREKDSLKLESEVSSNLETILNKQGYSFQYSVLRRAEKLLKERESKWKLDITELPGTINCRNQDFILQNLVSD